ncbi:MAG: hypothetical protein KME05_23355, partial [Gloeocapsa sp. UFS-A4-WI-NPMV-4B04]|nr:hypothetical protein [Gloeocapsa sp. UFS-A4-WI-NPMV-4B04]
GNLWKKSMGTIKIERFFPSKAQFDLVVQYFRSSFTQNSQPVVTQLKTSRIAYCWALLNFLRGARIA